MFNRSQFNLVALSLLLGIAICSISSADEQDEKALQLEVTSPAHRFDKGKKWAVLIGVNSYLDPSINNLKYCVADVRLMQKVLIEKCGYEKEHILVIADDQRQAHLRPLLTNLQNQIQNWLSHAEKGDTVLVFFSGHGFLDDQLQGYLAPGNCQRDNLAFWGFRTDDLRNKLMLCKASQKLLILDCCHSGAKGDGNKNPSSEEVAAGFEKAEGLITLASSRKKQESQEWGSKKQGLFTYFLAEGLGGKADKDKNGIVDSDEIYNYLIQKVPLAAQRELNKKQTPVRIIGEDVVGLFGLSRVSISLRPEMVAGSNDALLRFTVRNSSSKADLKPVVADAVVELLYRSSENARPQVLAKGTSDERGHVTLKTELTAVQQVKGEFLALVTRGEQSEMWRLTDFSKRGNWDLTIPVPSKPSLLIAPFDKQTATAKQTAWGKHLNRQVVETNSVGMKMVLVPPGEFTMGSSKTFKELVKLFDIPEENEKYYTDERPQHQVQITKPFYLGLHEVTVSDFRKFVNAKNYKTEPQRDGEGGHGWNVAEEKFEGRDPKYRWDHPGWKQTDQHPVLNITWNDAVAYCEWLSLQEGVKYRLPSEAEWEYACRAGSETLYYHGDAPEGLSSVGNVSDGTAMAKFSHWDRSIKSKDGYIFTSPVGQYRSNSFGLFDMHGNVHEWCSDWYDAEYYGTLAGKKTQNPAGPIKPPPAGSFRVLRGGSWNYYPEDVRSAYRSRSTPTYRYYYVGFRVVCVVE